MNYMNKTISRKSIRKEENLIKTKELPIITSISHNKFPFGRSKQNGKKSWTRYSISSYISKKILHKLTKYVCDKMINNLLCASNKPIYHYNRKNQYGRLYIYVQDDNIWCKWILNFPGRHIYTRYTLNDYPNVIRVTYKPKENILSILYKDVYKYKIPNIHCVEEVIKIIEKSHNVCMSDPHVYYVLP